MLRIENVSRLPTGLLLLEDTIPYLLGGRPRFVLDRLAPRRPIDVGYHVSGELRGRYRVGPLTVRLIDPFGLCELPRAFTSTDTLVVTPQVVAAAAGRARRRVGRRRRQHRRGRSRRHGEDDVATREYRHGDDLRRVHWRSTARRGELMVRREEQPWQSRGAVLLDTRLVAHRGDGPTSSLEWAVSAAASISLHLVRTGFEVRLITDTGHEVSSAGLAGASFDGTVLDSLAVVTTSSGRGLHTGMSDRTPAGHRGAARRDRRRADPRRCGQPGPDAQRCGVGRDRVRDAHRLVGDPVAAGRGGQRECARAGREDARTLRLAHDRRPPR